MELSFVIEAGKCINNFNFQMIEKIVLNNSTWQGLTVEATKKVIKLLIHSKVVSLHHKLQAHKGEN